MQMTSIEDAATESPKRVMAMKKLFGLPFVLKCWSVCMDDVLKRRSVLRPWIS